MFEDGYITVSMLSGSVRDRGNNPLDPTSMSFEYDNTMPTVDITTQVVFPTNKTRILYTAVFSGAACFKFVTRLRAFVDGAPASTVVLFAFFWVATMVLRCLCERACLCINI